MKLAVPVELHVDLFHGDEAVLKHAFENGNESVYAVGLVDDLDDDGQVIGRGQQPSGLQMSAGTESFDAAEDGSSCESFLAGSVQDGIGQWAVTLR